MLAHREVALEDVVITDQLAGRVSRFPDHAGEARALGDLADCMADSPQSVLRMLAEKVIELTGAHSSGISIAETDGKDAIFRWRATGGGFAKCLGGTMPRFNSPCGTVLERNTALLMHEPERYYQFTQSPPHPILEVLLVPFHQGGVPIGTVWAMAHTVQKTFDNEDKRLITSLSRFASAAVKNLEDLRILSAATATLTEESQRRTEFLATLSHELRNPLSPIVMGVAMLQQGSPESPGFHEAVAIIDRQARQLTRLVDDLLDVSRIATNKMGLRKARVGLLATLRMAMETSQPYLVIRGHRFQALLPKDEIYLDADSARLSQAVSNLLNNATRYTTDGGEIVLSATLGATDVVISVKDNGRGISSKALPKIFEMFAQGDQRSGGLGVGLTLVQRIVQMHGGTIEAISAGEALGSEFVMRLPLPLPSAVGQTDA